MPDEISRASPVTAELCSIADDLLEGADAIATFIYGSPQKRRKVYHLAQTSNLPVFRFGAVLCARKSRILEWIESQEMQADTRVQRLEKARRTERINKILAAEKIGGRA